MGDTPQSTTLSSRILKTESVQWRNFEFIQQETFKDLAPGAKEKLRQSIIQNEFAQPFFVWEDPADGVIYCLDGRHRTLIMEELSDEGYVIPEKLPATFISCSNKKEAAKMVLIYSSMYAKVTETGLFDFAKLYDLDFSSMKETIDLPDMDMVHIEGMFDSPGSNGTDKIIPQSLAERFIIPPFSIFDTRQGYWQDRKRIWSQLFNSQETREDVELIAKSGQAPAVYALRNEMREQLGREPEWDEIIERAKKKGMHIYEGASVFDPVLAEICYTWFCTPGGIVLDPFAGGSVRGIVAGVLGFDYRGIDLRADQVSANIAQAEKITAFDETHPMPVWIKGDSNDIVSLGYIPDGVDFIFSCPPYHDLEKYSDDPEDLSNMDYDKFCEVYRQIIFKSLMKLKPNRFACFVVGDIRDKGGFYRNFVSETISAFTQQPLCDGIPVYLYNEIILVNVAGSLPVRIGRQFGSFRKVGKMHQNVLVFYKGDPKEIKNNFPEIKVEQFEEQSEAVELL
ncbi:MAG: ParB N-terminal domain-containing protein [Ferruginibacter sp.]